MVDEWECQREGKDFDDFTARIDNPPNYIVDAVTRLQDADSGGLGAAWPVSHLALHQLHKALAQQ